MKVNLNIYESNLHYALLFSLASFALIMLLTFKVKEKPVPVRYSADTGTFKQVGAAIIAIILSILIYIFS